MINYLNMATAIYLIVSGGLFLYLHQISIKNVEPDKRKLWIILFFYFAACMFAIQLAVSSSNL